MNDQFQVVATIISGKFLWNHDCRCYMYGFIKAIIVY